MQSGRLQIYPSEAVFQQTDCPMRGFQLFSLSIPFARKQAQGPAILSVENRSYLFILKKDKPEALSGRSHCAAAL